MVTVSKSIGENAYIIVVENPTSEEKALVDKLQSLDPEVIKQREIWGQPTTNPNDDFKNINVPIEVVEEEPKQLTLDDGFRPMTDEELVDCPFIDDNDKEKMEARERLNAKKASEKAKPKQSKPSEHTFSQAELEKRKKNEGVNW